MYLKKTVTSEVTVFFKYKFSIRICNLFNGDGFCQIPRLVHIQAANGGDVIGQ